MNELIEFIKTGDNRQLADKLQRDPSLSENKTEQGISLLQFAAYCRNDAAIRLLKQYKSHLDIFEAAALGETDIVNAHLNENEGLLSDFSADGFTVLGLAAFFGHLDLALDLLEKGADPNVSSRNEFKVSPLHSACATSNLKMAELLIQKGADVNAKQMHGVTPIHSAAHNGQTALVQLLIDNNAEINAIMDNGQTPLSMAENGEFLETVELIRKYDSI